MLIRTLTLTVSRFFPMYYTLKEALCSENSIFSAKQASAGAICTSALT